MARKKHRKKKRSKSVGKRARKYYVSVKRNKAYRRKRHKRTGGQLSMFGPKYRVRHTVKRIGKKRRRRSHSTGRHTIGALTGAHHSIVG